MSKLKPSDAWTFYKLCQLVIDVMLRDDIHELEYGAPFSGIKPQIMCGVISELELQGVLDREPGTNFFTFNPSIYRLYFSRYYSTLVADRKRQSRQFVLNCILAGAAVASAFLAGYSASKHKAEGPITAIQQEANDGNINHKHCEILDFPGYPTPDYGLTKFFHDEVEE